MVNRPRRISARFDITVLPLRGVEILPRYQLIDLLSFFFDTGYHISHVKFEHVTEEQYSRCVLKQFEGDAVPYLKGCRMEEAQVSGRVRFFIILLDRFILWISKHWLFLANLTFGIYAGLPALAPLLMSWGHVRLLISAIYSWGQNGTALKTKTEISSWCYRPSSPDRRLSAQTSMS